MNKLKYGMKLLFPMKRVGWVPMLGIGLTSNDTPNDMVEVTVEKYWDNDNDPNKYKVKLIPTTEDNHLLYGEESLYSMDLTSLIREGIVKIV